MQGEDSDESPHEPKGTDTVKVIFGLKKRKKAYAVRLDIARTAILANTNTNNQIVAPVTEIAPVTSGRCLVLSVP